MTEHRDFAPIEHPTVRARKASARVLEVVELRGTPEQVERIRQTFASEAPPAANDPRWPLFASEALATFAEIVDGLLAEREPKRGRGRPPKNRPQEGETA